MDSEVVLALQAQLNHERLNAQKYFYLSDLCYNLAYDGFAKFYRKQAQGELNHAKLVSDFLASKRIVPRYDVLMGVAAGTNLLDFARFTLETEIGTTQTLEGVYQLAEENNEPQVCAFLVQMLVEQIEEENTAVDLVDSVSRTDANGWEILDHKYAEL